MFFFDYCFFFYFLFFLGYVKSWSWNFAGECVKKAELETIHAVGRNFLSVQRGYFDCELSPDEGLNTTELIRKISNATSLNFHIEDLDLVIYNHLGSFVFKVCFFICM